MAGTLPVLPGIINATREGPLFNVKIDTAESGAEIRTVWGTTPRYRYTIEVSLSDTSTVYTAQDLADLLESNYGAGDSFDMTDPVTSNGVTVRLDGQMALERYQRIPGFWIARFSAISVVNP